MPAHPLIGSCVLVAPNGGCVGGLIAMPVWFTVVCFGAVMGCSFMAAIALVQAFPAVRPGDVRWVPVSAVAILAACAFMLLGIRGV